MTTQEIIKQIYRGKKDQEALLTVCHIAYSAGILAEIVQMYIECCEYIGFPKDTVRAIVEQKILPLKEAVKEVAEEFQSAANASLTKTQIDDARIFQDALDMVESIRLYGWSLRLDPDGTTEAARMRIQRVLKAQAKLKK